MSQPHEAAQSDAPGIGTEAPEMRDGGGDSASFGAAPQEGTRTARGSRGNGGRAPADGRSRGAAVTPAVEATAAGGKVRGRTAGAGAPTPAGDPMSATTSETLERGPTTRGRAAVPSSAPEMQAPGEGDAGGRRRAAGNAASGGRGRAASALATGSDDASSTQAASRRGGGRNADGELRRELRAFCEQRRDGWNHDDWLGLLADLRSRGHDVSDEDRVGSALERERVALHLEGVDGLGPRRMQSLAERYGTIHELRGAEVDDLARVQGMNRSLAQKLTERLRG